MKIKYVLLFCLLPALNSACSAQRSSGFFILNGSNPSKDADQQVYSRNAQANALYVQGLEYLNKGDIRDGGSMLDAKKALELFRQAVKKDPQFALAYIGQAHAIDMFQRSTSGGIDPITVYRLQKAAALKAAALDDSLAEAHVLLGKVYYDNEYDWSKTEKEWKRVIELTPNDASAHTRYSFFLGSMGRFEEAETQAKLAQALDPKNAAPNRAMSLILYWQHRDDAAVVQGLEAIKKEDIRRAHYFLAFVYIHQGQFDKGIEELNRGSFGDADSLAGLAYAYAVAGKKAELNNTLEQLKHHPSHSFYGLAQVYAASGDKDRAISLLEKAYQERSTRMSYLKVDPTLDPLRQDPRFKQLMRKMNFEQ